MNAEGYMKPNKSGTMIAVVRYRAELELCDFNRPTGQVTGCITSSTILRSKLWCRIFN